MGKSDAENQLFTNQIKKEIIMANYRKRYSKMTGKWTPPPERIQRCRQQMGEARDVPSRASLL